jgi:peroxiredoxin Q/BCP
MEEFRRLNAQILGISFDAEQKNAAFAKKFDLPFPLLCDTNRVVGVAYGACESTGDDFSKRISYLIGPDGTIVKAYPRVNPVEHPAEVLADLTEASRNG